MTHIENIPHILEYGITHKNSKHKNPNFVNIGDVSLIDNRSTKSVNVDNGDYFRVDVPSIILGNYIPFYFGIKMPMLYVIQQGGNFVKKATHPKDIVYLACPISSVIELDLNYYFTDGHATDFLTSFYDKTKISDLGQIIDWNAVRKSYWGGHENLDIKRKKQAEFLLEGDLPSESLMGVVCYNEEAKSKLIELGLNEDKIKIMPGAYF